ncbi:nitrate/nitrite transporter [uncultured Aeromicrobium sp.]|uniref:MFS transporter n=1 Tax=uncultured Aeromicrobium sp. TaxID=337820 RepID=UPI0025D3B38E|nr:MFS transporter [uncultured Aeromicrobium sp.]
MNQAPPERHHPGAFLVWCVAVSTYLLAVFHRSSLAVAGLAASQRFDISAAQLASFTMLQLLVYAAMQVPVGLLVDRFGPRAVMLSGTVVLVLAQIGFGFANSYELAVLARIFVGIGDALTFVCVLRLISSWFAPRQIPLITQITGPIGQVGAIVAAAPMTYALGTLGWTRSYVLAAALSLVAAVAVLLLVRDEPGRRTVRGSALSWSNIRSSLGASWAQPGTRLGFWIHFTTQFSSNVLGLLWGFPFFVRGENTSEAFANALLTIMVLAVIAAGPVLGWFVAAYPWHRSTLVLAIIWSMMFVWALVLLWPGDAPRWMLVVLVIVVGVGGPASMVGFDLGRTSNPTERLGGVTGLINQGGFVASLVLVVAIGLILDAATPGTSAAYTPEAFTLAMSFQYILWAVGLLQIWRYRRKTRARLLRDDPDRWGRFAGRDVS